jgi:hypothetical protein
MVKNAENIIGEYFYESSSDDVQHKVTVYKNGTISCSCRGFSTPNRCWHVRDRADKLGRILDTSTWGASLGPALPAGESNMLTKEKRNALRDNKPKLPKLPEHQAAKVLSVAEPLTQSLFGESTFLPFIDSQCASALKEGMEIADYANDAWVMELKCDGHRIECVVNDDREVIAWARSGKVRILPPHIIKQFALCAPGTYDGELYFPGGTSTDVTRRDIQHLLKIALFDILRVGLQECMDLPATERRSLLEAATTKTTTDAVHVLPQYPVSDEGLQAIWNSGGEGVIIKRKNLKYFAGKRPKEWIKFKRAGAAEVTITGYELGSLGPHSKVLGITTDGIKIRVKTLNDEWRAEFAVNADKYVGRTLVISYQQRTPDGKFRHPMFDHLTDVG